MVFQDTTSYSHHRRRWSGWDPGGRHLYYAYPGPTWILVRYVSGQMHKEEIVLKGATGEQLLSALSLLGLYDR